MTAVVFLAAGGTGGHVFPAVAVAEQLAEKGFRPVLITDPRGRKIIATPPQGVTVHTILAASPFGDSRLKRIKGMLRLAFGAAQSQSVLLAFWHRPRAVMGFGGYPAVAPVIVGSMLGRPVCCMNRMPFSAVPIVSLPAMPVKLPFPGRIRATSPMPNRTRCSSPECLSGRPLPFAPAYARQARKAKSELHRRQSGGPGRSGKPFPRRSVACRPGSAGAACCHPAGAC